MSAIELPRREIAPRTIRIHEDDTSHWCFMHSNAAMVDPEYRPCFNPPLMREMHAYLRKAAGKIAANASRDNTHLGHIVIASDADVFNLGGDLDLFVQLIRGRDRERLYSYARECIEGVHILHAHLHPNAHTVALVQGDALGGGFELALSCQTIVAESGVNMGLPEVLFGLFPGMGAYSFISRRTNARLAEEMMLSGTIYSSDELYKLGLIDVLVGKGEGARAVEDLMRRNRRIPQTRMAMNKIRNLVAPVTLEELIRVTEVWVDTALSLAENQLRVMERLVRAQRKRSGDVADRAEAL
ncbi:MAG: crotonase/enoyl-CoA hydratase family protein [Xanthomonadaceae bacterium]|nr:crotonase/enoyl-CoA hydratase family protein [Xanthomonadaceae bacterium]